MSAGAAASPQVRLGTGVLATAVGGALGAAARWSLTDLFPVVAGHFPWPVFAINVLGAALLAGLPLLAFVRDRSWLAVFLGTGVLGGFTTMSAASTDTFALLDGGHVASGLAYCLGTLLAAVAVVRAVDLLTTATEADDFEAEGADE